MPGLPRDRSRRLDPTVDSAAVAVRGRIRFEEGSCSDDASARRPRPPRRPARTERRALFAKLAERPEHVCPFLGLEGDRTGYVEGVSDEHRCFAFGDPAPISAEQQTRVCQERGYGNCPRYLRGVLVIPTEELEALRRPRAAEPMAPPRRAAGSRPGAPAAGPRRARSSSCSSCSSAVAAPGACCRWPDGIGGRHPTPSADGDAATATDGAEPSAADRRPVEPRRPPPSAATPSRPRAPATRSRSTRSPSARGLRLYSSDAWATSTTRETSFAGFSFAQVEPEEGSEDAVYWVTQDGDLAGWAYRCARLRRLPHPSGLPQRRPASGVRSTSSSRALHEVPEATPAP